MAIENPCTNCTSPVAQRRPSTSGTHWCNRTECQAAKQKFFRGRRADAADTNAHPLRLQLVADLAHKERTNCICGLKDALPGWYHRDATGLKPCYAVGNQGKGLGPGYLDAIHPDRVPSA